MNRYIITNKEELNIILINTANKLGRTFAVVEKDYWVSVVLEYLFNHSKWKDKIAFKGGTSLSKCFNLIDRFSEDIDLLIDNSIFNDYKSDYHVEYSPNKLKTIIKKLNNSLAIFLKNDFLNDIKEHFKTNLVFDIEIFIDDRDKNTVLINYPKVSSLSYINPMIRLEFGCIVPIKNTTTSSIKPLISEVYPNLFKQSTSVNVVLLEQTFWEKATILHQEANRSINKQFPSIYSRHYYDLYKMSLTSVKTKALNNLGLLGNIIKTNETLYRKAWAKYDSIMKYGIKLIPVDLNLMRLEKDFENMKDLNHGDCPSFVTIINSLRTLENEINIKIKAKKEIDQWLQLKVNTMKPLFLLMK